MFTAVTLRYLVLLYFRLLYYLFARIMNHLKEKDDMMKNSGKKIKAYGPQRNVQTQLPQG